MRMNDRFQTLQQEVSPYHSVTTSLMWLCQSRSHPTTHLPAPRPADCITSHHIASHRIRSHSGCSVCLRLCIGNCCQTYLHGGTHWIKRTETMQTGNKWLQ